MFNIGPGEMMMLALLALLLFGPRRLPEIGKAAGEAIASFRNASKELSSEMKRQLEEENRPAAQPQLPANADSAPMPQLPAEQVAEALAAEPTPEEPAPEQA